MKQLLFEKGAVTLHDVPVPQVGPHEVLVVVYYAFVDSGSHRTIEQGQIDTTFLDRLKRAFRIVGTSHQQEHSRYQAQDDLHVLGASCSGQVIAVGSHVQYVAVGDWVACASAEYALHAELISVPERLVAVLHSKKHIRAASISAIGARALHTLRRSQAEFGSWVAVIGLGLLGQLTVQLARMQGCKVIALDIIPQRRDVAKKLGAERVYDAEDPSAVQHILRATRHAGVDTTLITANARTSAVMNQAAMITRKCGDIVVAGHVEMACDRQLLANKEITVSLATSYGPGRFNPEYEQHDIDYPYAYVRWTAQRNLQMFVETLERDRLDIDSLVTHEYELDEVDTAYQQVMRKTTVGVLLKYRYEEIANTSQEKTIRLTPVSGEDRDALRIGVIGVSDAVEHRLLPALSQVEHAHISTLVDADNTHVYRAGQAYAAEYISTDPQEILASKYVETIVIDDAAYMHDTYVLHQIERGIGVFLTRMPYLNAHELHKWRTYAKRYASAPICVNLHRSFSRHIQRIQRVCTHRNTPIFAEYRVAFQPLENESEQAKIERVVACIAQAVDMFITITQQSVRSFSVLPLHSPDHAVSRWYNCIIHFTFEDGSVCTCNITSLGSQRRAREELDVSCDGATLHVSDFTSYVEYDTHDGYVEEMFDDGFTVLVHSFFSACAKHTHDMPISLCRLVTCAEVANRVADQIQASAWHVGWYASAYTSLQQ